MVHKAFFSKSTVSKCRMAICAILCVLAFSSCIGNKTRYVIGVSQCSEDSWRTKLQEELIIATYFNEGIELRFTSAHDDSKKQQSQIDSLVASGIDMLIVSPNQVDNLTESIIKVRAKGIPVILYDRKISLDSVAATSNKLAPAYFMGADNYLIGDMLGHYVADKLNGKGIIVEIGGLKGSSPAQERHEGFANVIKNNPDMQIAAYQSGDWTEASGEVAMRRILKEYDGKIDAVYGGNDRMVAGARRVLREKGLDDGSIIYLGVDALPTTNGGIQQVDDGVITASAIYPTHGDELLQYAIDILDGKQVADEVLLKSSIVTNANAKVLLLQHEEVVRQAEYLNKMHKQAGVMHQYIHNQQVVIGFVLVLIFVIAVCLGLTIRNYQAKHRLNRQLETKNDELEANHRELSEAYNKLHTLNDELSVKNEELMHEKEVAERQRDELEEQRDKIIEMTITHNDGEASGDDVLNGSEPHFRRENEFLKKFLSVIEDKLSDPDLSVEDIGSEMCLSRTQLYRKVKALTGKSPVEIVREERLRRSHNLLADSSLSVSEIAYRVGFSSPSYFAKCYKDMFGKSPTDVQRL